MEVQAVSADSLMLSFVDRGEIYEAKRPRRLRRATLLKGRDNGTASDNLFTSFIKISVKPGGTDSQVELNFSDTEDVDCMDDAQDADDAGRNACSEDRLSTVDSEGTSMQSRGSSGLQSALLDGPASQYKPTSGDAGRVETEDKDSVREGREDASNGQGRSSDDRLDAKQASVQSLQADTWAGAHMTQDSPSGQQHLQSPVGEYTDVASPSCSLSANFVHSSTAGDSSHCDSMLKCNLHKRASVERGESFEVAEQNTIRRSQLLAFSRLGNTFKGDFSSTLTDCAEHVSDEDTSGETASPVKSGQDKSGVMSNEGVDQDPVPSAELSTSSVSSSQDKHIFSSDTVVYTNVSDVSGDTVKKSAEDSSTDDRHVSTMDDLPSQTSDEVEVTKTDINSRPLSRKQFKAPSVERGESFEAAASKPLLRQDPFGFGFSIGISKNTLYSLDPESERSAFTEKDVIEEATEETTESTWHDEAFSTSSAFVTDPASVTTAEEVQLKAKSTDSEDVTKQSNDSDDKSGDNTKPRTAYSSTEDSSELIDSAYETYVHDQVKGLDRAHVKSDSFEYVRGDALAQHPSFSPKSVDILEAQQATEDDLEVSHFSHVNTSITSASMEQVREVSHIIMDNPVITDLEGGATDNQDRMVEEIQLTGSFIEAEQTDVDPQIVREEVSTVKHSPKRLASMPSIERGESFEAVSPPKLQRSVFSDFGHGSSGFHVPILPSLEEEDKTLSEPNNMKNTAIQDEDQACDVGDTSMPEKDQPGDTESSSMQDGGQWHDRVDTTLQFEGQFCDDGDTSMQGDDQSHNIVDTFSHIEDQPIVSEISTSVSSVATMDNEEAGDQSLQKATELIQTPSDGTSSVTSESETPHDATHADSPIKRAKSIERGESFEVYKPKSLFRQNKDFLFEGGGFQTSFHTAVVEDDREDDQCVQKEAGPDFRDDKPMEQKIVSDENDLEVRRSETDAPEEFPTSESSGRYVSFASLSLSDLESPSTEKHPEYTMKVLVHEDSDPKSARKGSEERTEFQTLENSEKTSSSSVFFESSLADTMAEPESSDASQNREQQNSTEHRRALFKSYGQKCQTTDSASDQSSVFTSVTSMNSNMYSSGGVSDSIEGQEEMVFSPQTFLHDPNQTDTLPSTSAKAHEKQDTPTTVHALSPSEHYQAGYERNLSTSSSTFSQSLSLDSFQNAFTSQVTDPSVQSLHDELASATRDLSYQSHSSHREDDMKRSLGRTSPSEQAPPKEKESDSDEEPFEIETESHINVELEPEQPFANDFSYRKDWDPPATFESMSPDMYATTWNRAYLTRYNSFGDSVRPPSSVSQSYMTRHQSLGESPGQTSAQNRAYLSRYHSVGETTPSRPSNGTRLTNLRGQQSESSVFSDPFSDSPSHPTFSQQPVSPEAQHAVSDTESMEDVFREKQEHEYRGNYGNESLDNSKEAGNNEDTYSDTRQHQREYPVDSERVEEELQNQQDLSVTQQETAAHSIILEKPTLTQENAFLDSKGDSPNGTLHSQNMAFMLQNEFSNTTGRMGIDAEESSIEYSPELGGAAESSENVSNNERRPKMFQQGLFDTEQSNVNISNVEPLTSAADTSQTEENRLEDQPHSQQVPEHKLSPEEEEDYQIMQTLSELTQLWDNENTGEGSASVSSTSSFIPSDGERPKKMAYTSKVVSFSRQNSVNPEEVFDDEPSHEVFEKEAVIEETTDDSPDHADHPSEAEMSLHLSAQSAVENDICKQDTEQGMSFVHTSPDAVNVVWNNERDSKDHQSSMLAADDLLDTTDMDSGKADEGDSDELIVCEESLLEKASDSNQALYAGKVFVKSSDDTLALGDGMSEDREERNTFLFEDHLRTEYDTTSVMHVDRGEYFEEMVRKKLPGLSDGFMTGVPLPTSDTDPSNTESSSWIKKIVTAAKGAYDSLGRKLKRKTKNGEPTSDSDREEEDSSDEDGSHTEHDTDIVHDADSTNSVTAEMTVTTAGENMTLPDQQSSVSPEAQSRGLHITEFAEGPVTLETSTVIIPDSEFQICEQVLAVSRLHSALPDDYPQSEERQWENTGLQSQTQEPETDDLKPLLFDQTFEETSVSAENMPDDSVETGGKRLSATEEDFMNGVQNLLSTQAHLTAPEKEEEEKEEMETEDAFYHPIPTPAPYNSLEEKNDGIDKERGRTDVDAENTFDRGEHNPCEEDVFTASTDALKDSSSEQLSASSSTSASRSHSVSSDNVADAVYTVDGYEKLKSEPEEYFNNDGITFTNSTVIEEGYDGFVPSTDDKSRLRSRHRSGASERHDSYSTSEADDDSKDRIHKRTTQTKHKSDKSLHLEADSWMDYEADDETYSDRPPSVNESLLVLSNEQSQESDLTTGVEEPELSEQFSENQEQLQYTSTNIAVNKDAHVDTSHPFSESGIPSHLYEQFEEVESTKQDFSKDTSSNLEDTAVYLSSERSERDDKTEQPTSFEENHDEKEIHSVAKDIVSDVISCATQQVQGSPECEDEQKVQTVLDDSEPLEAESLEGMQLTENADMQESSDISQTLSASTEISTRVQTSESVSCEKPSVEIKDQLMPSASPGYFQSLSAESALSATDTSPLEDYPLTFGSTDIEDLSIFTETDLKQWSDNQATRSPTTEVVPSELICPEGDEELTCSKAEQTCSEGEVGLDKDDQQQTSSKRLVDVPAQPIRTSEDSGDVPHERTRAYSNKDVSRLSREFSDNSVNLGPSLSRSIDSLTLVNFEAQAAMQMDFAAQNAFCSSVDDLDSPVFSPRGKSSMHQTSSEDASWANDPSRDGVLSISSFDIVPSSPVDGMLEQESFSKSTPNALSTDFSQPTDNTSEPADLPTEKSSSGSVEEKQQKEEIDLSALPPTPEADARQSEASTDIVGPTVLRHKLQRSDALMTELEVSPSPVLRVDYEADSHAEHISGDPESISESGHDFIQNEQSLSVKAVCSVSDSQQSEKQQIWQQEEFVPDTSNTDPIKTDSQAVTDPSSDDTKQQNDEVSEEMQSEAEQPPDANGRSSPSWVDKVITTAKETYSSLGKKFRRKKKKTASDEDGEYDNEEDMSQEEFTDTDEDSADEVDDAEQTEQRHDGKQANASMPTGFCEPLSSQESEQKILANDEQNFSLNAFGTEETPAYSLQHLEDRNTQSTYDGMDDMIQMASATRVSCMPELQLQTAVELPSGSEGQSKEAASSFAVFANNEWEEGERDNQAESTGQSSESSQRFLEASGGISSTVLQPTESAWDSGHGMSLEEQNLSVKAVWPDTGVPLFEEPQEWQQEDLVPDTSAIDPILKDSQTPTVLSFEKTENLTTTLHENAIEQIRSEPEQPSDADVEETEQKHNGKSATIASGASGFYGLQSSQDLEEKLIATGEQDILPNAVGSEETPGESWQHFEDSNTQSTYDGIDDVIQMTSATRVSCMPEPSDLEGQSTGTAPSSAVFENIECAERGRDNQTDETGQSSESSQRFLEASDSASSTVLQPTESAWDSGHGVSLEEHSLSVKAVWPDSSTQEPEEPQEWQQEDFVPDTTENDPTLKDSQLLTPPSSEEIEHTDRAPEEVKFEQPIDADGRSSPSWMQKILTTAKDTYSSLEKRLRRKKKKKPASNEDGGLENEDDVNEEEEYTDSEEGSAEETDDAEQAEQRDYSRPDTAASEASRLYEPISSQDFEKKYHGTDARDCSLDLGSEQETSAYSMQPFDNSNMLSNTDAVEDVIQITSAMKVSHQPGPDLETNLEQYSDSAEQSTGTAPALELSTKVDRDDEERDNQTENRGLSSESIQQFFKTSEESFSFTISQPTESMWDNAHGVSLEEQNLSVEQSVQTIPSLGLTTSLQWEDKERETYTNDNSQSSESSQRFLEASDSTSSTVLQPTESAWDSGHGMSLEEQSLSVKAVWPDSGTPQFQEPQERQQKDFVPYSTDNDPTLKDSQLLIPLSSEEVEHINSLQHDRAPEEATLEPDADGQSSPSWMEKVVTTAKDAYDSLGSKLRRKKKKKPVSDEDGEREHDDNLSEEEEEYTDSEKDNIEVEGDNVQAEQRHDSKQETDASEASGLYEPQSSQDFEDKLLTTEAKDLSLGFGPEQETPLHTLQNVDDRDTQLTDNAIDEVIQMTSVTRVSHVPQLALETDVELPSDFEGQSLETEPSSAWSTNVEWQDTEGDSQAEETGQSSESSHRFLEATDGISSTVLQPAESAWDGGHGVSLDEQTLSVNAVSPDTWTSQSEQSQTWLQGDFVSDNNKNPNSPTSSEQTLDVSLSSEHITSLQWENKDDDIYPENKHLSSESSQRLLEASDGVSHTVLQPTESAWDSGHGVSLEEQSLSVKAVWPDSGTQQSEEPQEEQQEDFILNTSGTEPILQDSQTLTPLLSEKVERADSLQHDKVPEETPAESEETTDGDGQSSPSWMEKVVTTAKDAYDSLGRKLRRKKKKKPGSDEDGERENEDGLSEEEEEEEYTDSDEDSAEDKHKTGDVEHEEHEHYTRTINDASEPTIPYDSPSSHDFKQKLLATEAKDLSFGFDSGQESPIKGWHHDTRLTDDATDEVIQMSSSTRVSRMPELEPETPTESSSDLDAQSTETALSSKLSTDIEWAERRDNQTEEAGLSSESGQRFLEASDGISSTVFQPAESAWDSGHGLSLEEQTLSMKDVCPGASTSQSEESQILHQEEFVFDASATDSVLHDSQALTPLSSENVENGTTLPHEKVLEQVPHDTIPEHDPSESEQPTDGDGQSSPSWMEKVVTTARDTYDSLGRRLRRKKKKKSSLDDNREHSDESDTTEEEHTDSDKERGEDREDEEVSSEQLAQVHDGGLSSDAMDSEESEQKTHNSVLALERETFALSLKEEQPVHHLQQVEEREQRFTDNAAQEEAQMMSATMISRLSEPGLETAVHVSPSATEQSVEAAPSLELSTRLQWAAKEGDNQTEDKSQSSESSQRFLEASDELQSINPTESLWDSGHGVSMEVQSLSVKAVSPNSDAEHFEESQVFQQEDFVPETSNTEHTLKDSQTPTHICPDNAEDAYSLQQNRVAEEALSESERPTDGDGRSSPSWMDKVVSTAKDAYDSLGKKMRRKKKKSAPDEDGEQGIEDEASDEEYTDSSEDSAETRGEENDGINKMAHVHDSGPTDVKDLKETTQNLYESGVQDSVLNLNRTTFALSMEQEKPFHNLQRVDDSDQHSTGEGMDKMAKITSETSTSHLSEPDNQMTLNKSPEAAEQSVEEASSQSLEANLQRGEQERDSNIKDKGQSSESSQRFLGISDGLSCTVSQSTESTWDSGHGVSLEDQSLMMTAASADTITRHDDVDVPVTSSAELDAPQPVDKREKSGDDNSSFTEEEAASLSASDEEVSSDAKENVEADNMYRDTYFSALVEKKEGSKVEVSQSVSANSEVPVPSFSSEHDQKLLSVDELPTHTADYHETYVSALAERGSTQRTSLQSPDEPSSTDHQQDMEKAEFSVSIQHGHGAVEPAEDAEEDSRQIDTEQVSKEDTTRGTYRGSEQDTIQDSKKDQDIATAEINSSGFTTQDYDSAIVEAVLDADRRLSKSLSEDPSFHVSDVGSDDQNTDDDKEQSVFDQETSEMEVRDEPPASLSRMEISRQHQGETGQMFTFSSEVKDNSQEVIADMEQTASPQTETDIQVELQKPEKIVVPHSDTDNKTAAMPAVLDANTGLQSKPQMKSEYSTDEQLARPGTTQADRRSSWLKKAVAKAKGAYTSLEKRLKRKEKQKQVLGASLRTQTIDESSGVESSSSDSEEEEVDTKTIAPKAGNIQHRSCENEQLVLHGTTDPSMKAQGYDSAGTYSRENYAGARVSLPSQQGDTSLTAQPSSENEERLIQEERVSAVQKSPQYSGIQRGRYVEGVTMQQAPMSSASSEAFHRSLPQQLSEATLPAAGNQEWNKTMRSDDALHTKETTLSTIHHPETLDESNTAHSQEQVTGQLSTETNQHFITGQSSLNIDSSRQHTTASLGESHVLYPDQEQRSISQPLRQERAEGVSEGIGDSAICSSSSETFMRNITTDVYRTSLSSPSSTMPAKSGGGGSASDARQDSLAADRASSMSEYRHSVLHGTSELTAQSVGGNADGRTRSDARLSLASTYALSLPSDHQSYSSSEDGQRTLTGDREVLLQVRAAEAEYEGAGGTRTFLGQHMTPRTMAPRQFSADGTCDTLEADDKPLIGNEAAEDENEAASAAQADQENIDPSNMPLSSLFKTTKGKKSKSKKGKDKDKDANDTNVTDDATSKQDAKAEEQAQATMSDTKTDTMTADDQNSAAVLYTTDTRAAVSMTPGEGPQLSPPEGGEGGGGGVVVEGQPAKADGSLPPESAGREKQSLLHDHNPEGMVCCTIL